MERLLEGRVALITGGNGHIGRAIAREFAGHGASVILLDRQDAAGFAADLQSDYDIVARSAIADLSSSEHCTRVLLEQIEDTGQLDILVNNAAYVGTSMADGWAVPFKDQSPSLWTDALQVNLSSVFALCQAAAPALGHSGFGSIINISSIYGLVGPDNRLYEDTNMGNPAAYAASKGGLNQLTKWLSTEMAPAVRVNAIAPGGLERGQPEAFRQRYLDRTPLKRMATESDIAGPALFLASDLSAYVTGQILAVDGGWTAW